MRRPGPKFITKDLASVLILIIACLVIHCAVVTNRTDVYVDAKVNYIFCFETLFYLTWFVLKLSQIKSV